MSDSNFLSGSDTQQLTQEVAIEILHSTYRALTARNIEGALSHFAEDAVLSWGSFIFKGREGITRWIRELIEMFPTMRIIETSLTVRGNTVVHSFIIDFAMMSGRKGMLHVVAKYGFRGRKIQLVQMVPGLGFLILSEAEEQFGLGYSVKMRTLKP